MRLRIWIRILFFSQCSDPACIKFRIRNRIRRAESFGSGIESGCDSGSGSESYCLLFLDPGSKILDPDLKKNRIQDKHPGSTTLLGKKCNLTFLCTQQADRGAAKLTKATEQQEKEKTSKTDNVSVIDYMAKKIDKFRYFLRTKHFKRFQYFLCILTTLSNY
jgi:hypothetical protein